MKSITIRLPDVEVAMLVEDQSVNKAYRDHQGFLLQHIWQEYQQRAAARS